MAFLLIATASLIVALLFDMLPTSSIVKFIFQLQKESLKTIQNKGVNDEQKQKILLSYSGQVFYSTIKLILLLCITISPFILPILIENWICTAPSIGIILREVL